jgi:hypothetical protein
MNSTRPSGPTTPSPILLIGTLRRSLHLPVAGSKDEIHVPSGPRGCPFDS